MSMWSDSETIYKYTPVYNIKSIAKRWQNKKMFIKTTNAVQENSSSRSIYSRLLSFNKTVS